MYVSEHVCSRVFICCVSACVCSWISEESIGVSCNHSLPNALSEGFFWSLGLLPRLGWSRASFSRSGSTSPWSWGYSFCWDARHLRELESEFQSGCIASSLNRWAISLVCYLNIFKEAAHASPVVGFGRLDTQEVSAWRLESKDKLGTDFLPSPGTSGHPLMLAADWGTPTTL